MAEIGHIEKVSTVDGHIVCDVDIGSGPVVSAILYASGCSEMHPMKGDRVVFVRTGQEIIITAVLANEASTTRGQALIFSRNESGEVVASILLGSDGRVTVSPAAGARVGNGNSPVALATPLNTFLSTLVNAVSPGGTSVVTPSPGAACPVATAIRAAATAAFPPALSSPNCGSSNLSAD